MPGMRSGCWIFTDKTFANRQRKAKFAKVFSRKRNPLYGILGECMVLCDKCERVRCMQCVNLVLVYLLVVISILGWVWFGNMPSSTSILYSLLSQLLLCCLRRTFSCLFYGAACSDCTVHAFWLYALIRLIITSYPDCNACIHYAPLVLR